MLAGKEEADGFYLQAIVRVNSIVFKGLEGIPIVRLVTT